VFKMTRVTFLGTGGGRFATVYQVRRTGGIFLEDGTRVHLDPGPGAVVGMSQLGWDPGRTDAILISHCHPDHYGDAEVLVEGMTCCSFKRRGLLAGSISAIYGNEEYGPAVSDYHRRIAGEARSLVPGDRIELERMSVVATRTSHSDKDGIGFRFETANGIVSYVSDSELTEEVIDDHRGARVLIMNVTRPLRSRVRFHMTTEDAAEMVQAIAPEIAVLTHFGSKFINDGIRKQESFVQESSGIRTVAAEDFMTLSIGRSVRVRRRPLH
jgi:phosphoribosyl 1,2-cyclic phosphodiesterase